MNPLDQILTAIARDQLGIPTLESRHSDSLDFHSVSAWAVRSALKAAFDAGAESAGVKSSHTPTDHETGRTPAPWEDNGNGLIYGQCSGDDGEAPFVADVCDNPNIYTNRERANARLIETASELLNLAKRIMLAKDEEQSVPVDIYNAAVRLVAKAEPDGEAS